MAEILKACCDETGTHDGAQITCVGGYLFDPNSERDFSAEWREVMRPFKKRGIEFFHANQCYGRKGKFENLTKAESKELFDKLIVLTRRTAKFGIVSGIEDEVFKRVVQRNKFQTFTGSKYTICALRSLTLIEQWANENNFEGKIVYLFESGNEHQGEANAMMDMIKENPTLRVGFRYESHDFIPKSQLPPLQAADMFVWLFQRSFAKQKKDPFFVQLLHDGGIRHLYQPITDVSLGVLALQNMHYGVKSNRTYETQQGSVKTYTI